MAYLPLRTVALPEASERVFDAWLDRLEAACRLRAPTGTGSPATSCSGSGTPACSDYDALVEDPATPAGHPRLAPEPRPPQRHPRARVLRRRGPRALCPGQAAALAVAELRPLAARRGQRPPRRAASAGSSRGISSPAVGRNFKCFHFVEFSYGYNLEVGDDCVVHRHVLLDDRGGITLGDRVSISDYANIYSHTHSIVDQKDVTNARTVLEDDVRITYHATVLAGRAGRPERDGGRRAPWPPRTSGPITSTSAFPPSRSASSPTRRRRRTSPSGSRSASTRSPDPAPPPRTLVHLALRAGRLGAPR